MAFVQPLIITQSKITPFSCPFIKPFQFAGNTLSERTGFYIELTTADGITAQGEIAPLPGMSQETLKKAKHDWEVIEALLLTWKIPLDKKDLIAFIRGHEQLSLLCASVRFGVESALISLAAKGGGQTLNQFLGASVKDVPTAALLQGTHAEMMADAQAMKTEGHTVFKLKVGDRNIPLDVKKVQDLRAIIGKDGLIRLDANRVWSFTEAVLFAQLAGHGQIEFIEEPLSDTSRLVEFYQSAHIPIALDETLSVMRCGVTAPGRCMPTLASNDAVKAYVIKPSVLGGVVVALDWIEEAHSKGKQAVISSAFESPVGMNMLKALAALTENVSGLGTERWFKHA